jgi:cGMP-dependent protein kinase
MAPEVISGKGYGYFADLWSVGVCVYEFICGGLPFGEEAEDPFEIYKEIIKKPISYPHFMSDKTAKTFIEQLMNKIPEVRLGGSYSTLKSHTWFKDFDWVFFYENFRKNY